MRRPTRRVHSHLSGGTLVATMGTRGVQTGGRERLRKCPVVVVDAPPQRSSTRASRLAIVVALGSFRSSADVATTRVTPRPSLCE